jgi:hypothetical protein
MFSGQRFEVDLGDDDEKGQPQSAALPGIFVADVLERKPAAPTPPSAPTLKNKSGFPEHRKRKVESRFKQRIGEDRVNSSALDELPVQDSVPTQPISAPQSIDGGKPKTWEEEEKQRIAAENDQKLAQMSSEEIEEERRELMNSLSPAVLQRLLQRSNIDSGSTEADLSTKVPDERTTSKIKKSAGKTVSFAEDAPVEPGVDSTREVEDAGDEDGESPGEQLPHDSVHFPQPTQPPDLDPSSETFLQDLHQKYFPSLPSDPDKLEWMQDSKTSKTAYDPSATALKPKDIRFSFKGELLPPKTASQIPVTAGLHHHGDAPDAAGYTITELVHLGHSSFAPQRCVAFQTLGRILYRLGKGEFGDAGELGADSMGAEDTFGELARGLWHEVEREKVVEMLIMESEGKGVDGGKHVSARSYATEAVWLWQKGGGRRWKAG